MSMANLAKARDAKLQGLNAPGRMTASNHLNGPLLFGGPASSGKADYRVRSMKLRLCMS
jgi:hypothetical protein